MSNKLKPVLCSALGVVIGFASGAPLAQQVTHDIDLFLNESVDKHLPNVIIMLDNSANWDATINDTTKKAMEHQALYQVLTSCEMRGGTLDDSGSCVEGGSIMNLGIMSFANSNSPRGGKVILHASKLDAAHQDKLAQLLYEGAEPVSGNEAIEKANNAPYAMMFNEAYRYMAGEAPHAGLEAGHDPDAINAEEKYNSPASTCSTNYAILIGNGEPDGGENKHAEEVLANDLDAMFPGFPLGIEPDTFESNWADEFAWVLAGRDLNGDIEGTQHLITHVIDAHEHLDAPPAEPNAPDDNPHREDPDYNKGKFKGARAWLANIAKEGDGRYFSASSTEDIEKALGDIMDDLVATNSVYASTTLPVSVNVRGTHLNQVYMGVFRPDEQGRTRWWGNLKMYHMALDSSGQLYLADENGSRVEDAVNGFILNDAKSFWTSSSDFWHFSPRGVPPSASDSPDGPIVEKGGAAQHLRENFEQGRTLYTCNDCSELQDFGNATVSAADLGAASATERDSIIAWIRGEDIDDEDKDASTSDARATIHGDVLHSQPAVVNYNRYGDDNDIVAFYGANDGIFHAVKGGKGPTGAYEAGTELWGLIPGEFLGKLKALYDNDQSGSINKQYFMDGGIGVYQYDANDDGKLIADDGDKVHLYVGMRRGGRLLYALDVSDPENPSFLWKKSETDVGWEELGQTWSSPEVITSERRVEDDSGNLVRELRPLLIFGGGYDASKEDARGWSPYEAGLPEMGRGIFVADALTGDLIWQAGPAPTGATVNKTVGDMRYSMPSDVTAIDLNGDKSVDRLYIGDTGGQIWRIDVASQEPADWTVHKFASLTPLEADGRPSSLADHRKFLYAPDVVWDREDDYLAILIGSGDREKPGERFNENRFYMLKDTHTSLGIAAEGTITPIVEADLYDATDNDIQDGTDAEKAAARTSLDSGKGWYIRLAEGEKVVSDAVSVDGTTVFNTNQPDLSSSKCEQLGIARVYQISYKDASATRENDGTAGINKHDRSGLIAGGGYPPPPVPIVVEIDGEIVEGISIGPVTKEGSNQTLESRKRAYWYKEDHD